MYYFCTDSYNDIPLGSIVLVDIGEHQVYINHNKHVTCTNLFILEMHFKRMGGKQ